MAEQSVMIVSTINFKYTINKFLNDENGRYIILDLNMI